MIELKNISKTYYDNGKKVEALKNVNLSFNPGEIVGIIGYSGAGKSTLLRCINLLEPPTTGEVIINGVTLNTLNDKELREIRKKIGMIFQHFNLMKSRTISKNISYPLKGSNLSKKEIDLRVEELLELVNLKEKKENYPSQLSGGQKQRIAIARALIQNPEILILDEATSALDTESERLVQDALDRLMVNRTTFVIAHRLSTIINADKIVVMENGRIKEVGRHQDLLDRNGLYKHFYDIQFGKEVKQRDEMKI